MSTKPTTWIARGVVAGLLVAGALLVAAAASDAPAPNG
jgi:hypothetical protein